MFFFSGSAKCIPSVKIPRMGKQEMNALKVKDFAPIRVHPFTGQKKPIPPAVEIHSSLPYDHVKQLHDSINTALEKDVSWLKAVIEHTQDDKPEAEWSGFMVSAAKKETFELMKSTNYVFGPLLDSPPSHPDTVLTTLVYIEKFMQQHGVPTIHVSADMQLYKIAMQINNVSVRLYVFTVSLSFHHFILSLLSSK